LGKTQLPLAPGSPYYILVESEGGEPEADAASFETALASACEDSLLSDAVIAKSERERLDLWALRDNIETIFARGDHIDFDVGLPASAMEAYVEQVRQTLATGVPDAESLVFGHIADGNLHVIVSRPAPFAPEEAKAIKRAIYVPLEALRGSVSAEHGIGLDKKPYLAISRNPAELDVMHRMKRALDPHGLLNPGKVIG
jgi:FAD/FMN-containing dehydrogenase